MLTTLLFCDLHKEVSIDNIDRYKLEKFDNFFFTQMQDLCVKALVPDSKARRIVIKLYIECFNNASDNDTFI